MKKVVLMVSLLCIAILASGQGVQDSIISKENYLQKSKNIRTTAWILLAGGSAMMVTGLIVTGSDFLFPETQTGSNLIVGGLFIDLVSIPFFVSASEKARRAAAISLNTQDMLLPNTNILALKAQPTLTLKIQL